MPTVLLINNLRFFFFSREETRKHIHICSEKGEAKFWIEPEISLAMSQGIPTHELAKIENIVKEHQNEIKIAWQKHFGR